LHKFEKAEKIEFSYDIDFKDPYNFNSFTTNDDSLIAKEKKNKIKFNNIKNKNLANTKNKNLNIFNKNKQQINSKNNNAYTKHIENEENYDTTDHEIFHKNKKENEKKNNVFLENLNKSMDSRLNVASKAETVKKQNANQSTNYTLNSPSGAHNNTNSLIKSINNNNNKNAINIISEVAPEEHNNNKDKNNEFIENAKSEFANKKNQNTGNTGKKGLKEFLLQKNNIEDFKNDKQKLLKDLVTKVLIERILMDKNKKAVKAGLVAAPATNEELYFFLREKDFSGKYGTGKFLDLGIDEKNAREITEKCLKEKLRTLLNKKKLRDLISGQEKKNYIKNKEENEDKDIILSIENKLFEKFNKENTERDNFLDENFKNVLQRLVQMEKSINVNVASKNKELKGLENEINYNNKEKLSESQYIEIDKSNNRNNKANNYVEMIDIITEKIKSNMHITINLNTDGKNLSANNNSNNNNANNDNEKDKLSNENEIEKKNINNFNSKENQANKDPMGYTHPFAGRNKIFKMLDNTNYFQNKEHLMQNIPLPRTINFKDFEISSESCLTDSKRSQINTDFNNLDNNLYASSNNKNLLYYTNIDNKIPNFQVTGSKFAEDQLGYVNSLKINSYKNNEVSNLNNYYSNEKHILEANILAAELDSQKNFNNLAKITSKDESLSEGQIATVSRMPNDSELESVYLQSHTNTDLDELDELNEKILRNKLKLEGLNRRNIRNVKNPEINLNDLKNINQDLEETLEKYNNKNLDNNFNDLNKNNFDKNNNDIVNDDYDESSGNRYDISNSNENNENYGEYQKARKMGLEDLNQNKPNLYSNVDKNVINNKEIENEENKNLNSEAQMEEKIKFLKTNNLYDSDEQANFQRTFQGILRKNNVLNSDMTSPASNFNNVLNNFNNNNNNNNVDNLSGSLASSGKLRLGSAKHNFLAGNNNNNNNHVFQSFGGNLLNSHNQFSNRSNNNNNNFNNNYNFLQAVNSPQSNISSNVNSGRMPNESLNLSNQINLENSNNLNYKNNNNIINNNNNNFNVNDKFYFGYNNTISENHTESNNDSAVERGMNNYKYNDNNKFYKTDESSLDTQN
jgi:hypothetical protein